MVYLTNSANGLSFNGEITRRFLGGEHPAPAFLGYASYKKDGNQSQKER